MSRARGRDLPDVELLTLDDEEAAAEVTTVEVQSKRWWPVALGAVLVAGAIVVTGRGGGAPEEASPATTASTLFPPASTSLPTARATALAARRSDPAVLVSSDASALIVLSQDGAFEVDVTEPPATIDSYVARAPATVVTLTNGLARAHSRLYPDGIPLGDALAVFPSANPTRVWLTKVVDGTEMAAEVPVDGTLPVRPASTIAVPDGYHVVGVAGDELVLSTTQASASPDQLRTWQPSSPTTDFLTQKGALLAAASDVIAWTRPGCADCGIYLRRGSTVSVITSVPNLDRSVPGAFSHDRRFLAVAITGAWPGGGTGAIVHAVAVIDLDQSRNHGVFDVATPDIRSTTPVAMTWSAAGALLVRDTSDRIVAYEPEAGGTARLFEFRPRENRPPSPLTTMAVRIPHTMPSLAAPRTTLAPVPIPPG